MNQISKPAPDPVWWGSLNKQNALVYTKCQTWVEARQELGGNPQRVTEESLIKELDEQLAKIASKSR